MNDVFMPVYTTSLIGRVHETAEVVALINNPDIQLVTLIGTSGTGKTRLSIEVVNALKDVQHTVFIPLAAITKAEFVLPAIAHQLGLKESGSTVLLDLLVDYLRQHPLMLVLDNFEQVLSAAKDLARIIQAVPVLNVLVTSQVPLNIDSETVYMIPGLDVPTTIPETPEAALQCAAVQLFVQRIQAVQPKFELSKDNIEPVVEICQMLEGLPLAIEIVAAHSAVLTPRDLQVLVKQHLRLYRFRAKGATGRQRIILPMIEWSLLRLPQSAQDLFNQLGVFQGGWQLEALEAVVQDVADIEAMLRLLTERHLVLEQAEEEGLPVRYMLLDAVQDFANTRFARLSSDQQAVLMYRHMQCMYELTKVAQTDLVNGINQSKWMKRLRQEVPNVRLLLEWGLAHDPLKVAELSQYLGRFWLLDGYWKEGMQWYSQIKEKVVLSAELEARIAVYDAILLSSLGLYERSEAVSLAGIKAAEEAGDKDAEGRLYIALGLLAKQRLNYKYAQVMFEHALVSAKAIDNQGLQLVILVNAASIKSSLKAYDQALLLYQEALTIARHVGNKVLELATLANLGNLYSNLGQPEQALQPLNEVIEGLQIVVLKDLYGVALSFKAQALALSHQSGAVSLFQESIQLLKELGAVMYLCETLDMTAGFFGMHAALIQAARIVGGVDMIRRDVLHVPRNPEKANPNRIFDELIVQHGDTPAFQAARREGESWSMEQIVEYALQELAAFET